jgi:hypothetical protein
MVIQMRSRLSFLPALLPTHTESSITVSDPPSLQVLIAYRKSAFEPHYIFKNTLKDICKEGILHYKSEFQRCGFTFKDGGKCVAFSLTH